MHLTHFSLSPPPSLPLPLLSFFPSLFLPFHSLFTPSLHLPFLSGRGGGALPFPSPSTSVACFPPAHPSISPPPALFFPLFRFCFLFHPHLPSSSSPFHISTSSPPFSLSSSHLPPPFVPTHSCYLLPPVIPPIIPSFSPRGDPLFPPTYPPPFVPTHSCYLLPPVIPPIIPSFSPRGDPLFPPTYPPPFVPTHSCYLLPPVIPPIIPSFSPRGDPLSLTPPPFVPHATSFLPSFLLSFLPSLPEGTLLLLSSTTLPP